MNTQFLAALRAFPFTPARRIFVLEAMLLRMENRHLHRLADAARALITMDHATLRRLTRTQRPSRDHLVNPPHDHFSSPTLEGHKRLCHEAFVDLVALLIDQEGSSTVVFIVEPARRQLRRLQDFASRPLIEAAPRTSNAHLFSTRTHT